MESIQVFAKRLDGREYKKEMTQKEIQLAADAGYVVAFGCSDDRTVFHGAIEEECLTVNGGELYITEKGLFKDCPCNCIYAQEAKKKANLLVVRWCKGPYVWSYKTEIPHVSFEIIDNQPAENLKFCQGIVFDLSKLKNK
ncbi:MAG: hypothetical protein RR310_04915 [Eubacterium sp.]